MLTCIGSRGGDDGSTSMGSPWGARMTGTSWNCSKYCSSEELEWWEDSPRSGELEGGRMERRVGVAVADPRWDGGGVPRPLVEDLRRRSATVSSNDHPDVVTIGGPYSTGAGDDWEKLVLLLRDSEQNLAVRHSAQWS